MNIQGKCILLLGGAGMVGTAVARQFLIEGPARVIVHSLREAEASAAVALLREEQELWVNNGKIAGGGSPEIVPVLAEWGNLFVRNGLHLREPNSLLADAEARRSIIADLLGQPEQDQADHFYLYSLIARHRPDLVVDTVNTATGIAYGDLYSVAADALEATRALDPSRAVVDAPTAFFKLQEATERLLATQYVPQLVRHVQVLWRAMKDSGTSFYVKIGTSGTGGMGLNIPYTHGEERPSRMLLSKSAIAGAQTLLLFLQARTPNSPITKEIVPAAAIAWKQYGYGEVRRKGHPIELEDAAVLEPELALNWAGNPPTQRDVNGRSLHGSRPLAVSPQPTQDAGLNDSHGTLRAVYVDTGENGLFSVDEFVAISTVGQMEFVTPEEIARNVVAEVKGANTGKDVIDALNIACMGPTYRAGFARSYLLDKLRRLQENRELPENGSLAMAFEVLGPPRLSKLLYEAYLIKLCYGTVEAASAASPGDMAGALRQQIEQDRELRMKIISIGIPILLETSRGIRLLRGKEVAIPSNGLIDLNDRASVEVCSAAGWVDLRVTNMHRWSSRLHALQRECDLIPANDTSSRHVRDRDFWRDRSSTVLRGTNGWQSPIEPGEIVGWLFNTEDQGERGRD